MRRYVRTPACLCFPHYERRASGRLIDTLFKTTHELTISVEEEDGSEMRSLCVDEMLRRCRLCVGHRVSRQMVLNDLGDAKNNIKENRQKKP